MLAVNGDRVVPPAVAIGEDADRVLTEDAVRRNAAYVGHSRHPLHALAFLGGSHRGTSLALRL